MLHASCSIAAVQLLLLHRRTVLLVCYRCWALVLSQHLPGSCSVGYTLHLFMCIHLNGRVRMFVGHRMVLACRGLFLLLRGAMLLQLECVQPLSAAALAGR
jgi:hypothetical protein